MTTPPAETVDAALAWLHAQLDAEERLAKAASCDYDIDGPERWWAGPDDPPRHVFGRGGSLVLMDVQPEVGRHIAAQHPHQVLERVRADRALLRFLDPTEAMPGEGRDVAWRAVVVWAQRYADPRLARRHPGFPTCLRLGRTP